MYIKKLSGLYMKFFCDFYCKTARSPSEKGVDCQIPLRILLINVTISHVSKGNSIFIYFYTILIHL